MEVKRVILASRSLLKLGVVRDVFQGMTVDGWAVPGFVTPAQPVNSGGVCCGLRCEYIRSLGDADLTGAYLVAIENEISTGFSLDDDRLISDVCHVRIETSDGRVFMGKSSGIPVPERYVTEAFAHSSNKCRGETRLGIDCTVGSIIASHEGVEADNWMRVTNGIDRRKQICEAFSMIDGERLGIPDWQERLEAHRKTVEE